MKTKVVLLFLGALLLQSCTFVRIMKRKDFNLHYCFKESKIPVHTKGVYYHVREISDEERKNGYGRDTYYNIYCIMFFRDGTYWGYVVSINRRVIDREIIEDKIRKSAEANQFFWSTEGCGVYHIYPDDSVKIQVTVTLPYLINTGIFTLTGHFDNDTTFVELGSKINWRKKSDQPKQNPEPKRYTFLPIDFIPDVSSFWFKKKHWYRKKLNSCN